MEQVRVFSSDAAVCPPFVLSVRNNITFYCDCTADRSPRMHLLPAGIGRNLCRRNIRETANGVIGLWSPLQLVISFQAIEENLDDNNNHLNYK